MNSRISRRAVVLRPAAVIFFLLTTLSNAQTPADAFARGNELYRKGQFQDALKEYESILRQGYVSPELHFNIGNGYFRLGKIAPAILAYERAKRMYPNDPDVVYNLKLLNLRTIDRIEPVPELFVFQWLRVLGEVVSEETATKLFVLSWVLVFSSLTVVYASRKATLPERIRWLVLVGFIGSVVFGSIMGLQYWQKNATKGQAVISSLIVTAKTSPDEQSVDAFVIHEGLKVRTSDRVGDWLKVVLPDGKVGWIRSQQCELI